MANENLSNVLALSNPRAERGRRGDDEAKAVIELD